MTANKDSRLRRVGVRFLGAVIGVLAAEVISAVAYSVANGGEIFWTRGHRPQDVGRPAPADLPKTFLHPVFGFVNRPGISVGESIGATRVAQMTSPLSASGWQLTRANADGFFAPGDYPVPPSDANDYFVGVFGGSVAQWLVVQSGEYLAESLQALPGLSHRRVRVLSFAQGGFKYPQQIQALAFFSSIGQRFDLVIDVGGFNEIALSAFNVSRGVDPAIPSFMHLGPLGRFATIEPADSDVARARSLAARVRKMTARADESRLALLWLVRTVGVTLAERRLASVQERLTAAPESEAVGVLAVRRTDSPSSLSATCREAAEQWRRSSLMMHVLAESLGAEFIEVIQPNQYYSHHQFSAAERARAIDPRSVFREPVEAGYPMLRRMADDLRGRGVRVVDAVGVFDDEPRAVFSDSCCHLNELGNRGLIDRIVGELRTVGVEELRR